MDEELDYDENMDENVDEVVAEATPEVASTNEGAIKEEDGAGGE